MSEKQSKPEENPAAATAADVKRLQELGFDVSTIEDVEKMQKQQIEITEDTDRLKAIADFAAVLDLRMQGKQNLSRFAGDKAQEMERTGRIRRASLLSILLREETETPFDWFFFYDRKARQSLIVAAQPGAIEGVAKLLNNKKPQTGGKSISVFDTPTVNSFVDAWLDKQ